MRKHGVRGGRDQERDRERDKGQDKSETRVRQGWTSEMKLY